MHTNSISEYEVMILTTFVGILESIRNRVMSIEEAENYLISPYSADMLKEMGIRPEISHLIYCGCELENIERLIPDKLDITIRELIEESLRILSLSTKPTLPTKKWLAS